MADIIDSFSRDLSSGLSGIVLAQQAVAEAITTGDADTLDDSVRNLSILTKSTNSLFEAYITRIVDRRILEVISAGKMADAKALMDEEAHS